MERRIEVSDYKSSQQLTQRLDAEARVADTRRAVNRQRKIVAAYRRRGMNARDAEFRLKQLDEKLAGYEADLRNLGDLT
jgi:hypothetical protein